jgi:hypothetical protein
MVEKMPSLMPVEKVGLGVMKGANYMDSPFISDSESVKRMAEKNGQESVNALFLNGSVNHRIRNGIRS